MKLNHSSQSLSRALDDLMRDWESTGAIWKDKARHDFQTKFIADLSPTVRAAMNAMQSITQLMKTVNKECR